jgi:hypothetical protein
MITYGVYRLVHILGILVLFLALGGLSLHAASGGGRDHKRSRRLAMATHGIGLFVILLGGFGMLARLGINTGFPGWIWAKLGVWLVLGALVMLPYRFPALARPLWLIVPLLGTVAAYMALYKPF